jgi:hypothetical protein
VWCSVGLTLSIAAASLGCVVYGYFYLFCCTVPWCVLYTILFGGSALILWPVILYGRGNLGLRCTLYYTPCRLPYLANVRFTVQCVLRSSLLLTSNLFRLGWLLPHTRSIFGIFKVFLCLVVWPHPPWFCTPRLGCGRVALQYCCSPDSLTFCIGYTC